MDRRSFLTTTALALGAGALGVAPEAAATTARPGRGPYGPLQPPDANGVMLPRGFRSRVLARTGEPVGATGYVWHGAPDGGAVFPQPDGGWAYASNSEAPLIGGAGALRFDRRGEVVDAYRILTGTSMNCAGGPTPWGTWLSCEEHDLGQVWECDPSGPGQGVPLPALGVFAHEAVAVDPVRKQLYLTEDETDGRLYRFTPESYPDLTSGALEVLSLHAGGRVTWLPTDARVPQSQSRPAGSAVFPGGEGVWYDAGHVYFTNKGQNRVWDLDAAAQRLTVLYDAVALGSAAPLTGVDNVVISRSGDIVIAEDGGNLELVLVTPQREVAPLLRVVGQDDSELTGPAFSPDGSRLYFSSQRGISTPGLGITYEVRGPFRTRRTAPPARGRGVPAV